SPFFSNLGGRFHGGLGLAGAHHLSSESDVRLWLSEGALSGGRDQCPRSPWGHTSIGLDLHPCAGEPFLQLARSGRDWAYRLLVPLERTCGRNILACRTLVKRCKPPRRTTRYSPRGVFAVTLAWHNLPG